MDKSKLEKSNCTNCKYNRFLGIGGNPEICINTNTSISNVSSSFVCDLHEYKQAENTHNFRQIT